MLGLLAVFSAAFAQDIKLSDTALQQIVALDQEKTARTAAQKKMDSQLIYARSKVVTGMASAAALSMEPDVTIQPDGRVLLDITATVSDELLAFITNAGGQVVNSFAQYDAIRALVPLAMIEELAGRTDVRFVSRAHEAMTNTGSVDGEGDTCHRAIQARSTFGVDGTGVKVGVLSDSADYLATAQSLGDLGSVTVLPGQAGSGAGEGTAMMEIIHDLAPGAALYFATAFSSPASFAANIDTLVSNGCDIIVDDVTYLNESPFQDGQSIAKAVKRASDAGVLYFSSARNSGNKNDGTSGTWEGDFSDGGAAGSPLPAGRLHNFGGGTNYDTVTAVDSARADLFWSDPLGGSTNDYDLYVLNSAGTAVVRSGTTTQNGTQDPYESVSTLNVGERIVILQKTGASGRFLHLDTGRCRLAINTDGNVRGHNASSASNAFSVAAVSVHTTSPFPSAFTGGAGNPVETFSSDGPRRLFYNPNGTAITPGNFTSTGGMVFQKPDIAAADGASESTAVPGFSPFYGTSAAAPHAAAVAALLKSYNSRLTPAEMRATLTGTALDIEAAGVDRDSGAGIVMAYQALQSVPTSPNLSLVTATYNDVVGGNGNGFIDPGETIRETLVWTNSGTVASNITGTLTTSASGVTMLQSTAAYSNLPAGGVGSNTTPFIYKLSKTISPGATLVFTGIINSGSAAYTGTFTHVVGHLTSGALTTNTYASTNVPAAILDLTTIYCTNILPSGNSIIDDVNVGVRLDHTYDSDLVLAVQHPDSTEVVLATKYGGSGDNYGTGYPPGTTNTVFDDQAGTLISAGSPPFTGSYKPDGALTNLNGKTVGGIWRLRVSDTAGQDTGTVYAFSLIIASHSNGYLVSIFNNPPAASNQSVTAYPRTSTNLTLTGSDPDGDAITFQTNSLPLHGSLSSFNPSTGSIIYTPDANYAGADSFTFMANDGTTNSTVATVSITVVDNQPPTVTINQAAGQADPTNSSPINFTVVFSEPVADFATGDVTITGTAPGTLTGTITGTGTAYNVAVSGMTDSGTVIATIATNKAHDAAGNGNTASASTDNTVTYDVTVPSCLITRAGGSPTNAMSVQFSVLFSEAVTDFTAGDVALTGTALGKSITGFTTNTASSFTVTAGSISGTGTVTIAVAAGTCTDAAGNLNTAGGPTSYDIIKGLAQITLGALSQTYDGTPRVVTATTVPSGLTVEVTYDGSLNAPTNAGSYAVIGTVVEANYQGWTNGTLTVEKAAQTISFEAITNQLTTNVVFLSATASSGLTVEFAVASGPGETNGTFLTFTGTGEVAVVASQSGDGNRNTAPGVTNIFNVTKAPALVTLQNLAQFYDGTPRAVTATTVPTGLAVEVTYDGSATVPINAGSYAVTGTVNEAMYQGEASGTLTVTYVADVDGDGLPNWWEEQYFGGITNADPTAICSNGVNTVFDAYVAGFDPTDPAAGFVMTRFGIDAGDTDRYVLEWTSATGRVYTIYWTSNLLSTFTPMQSNYTGGVFTDAIHSANDDGFYRTEVRLAP